MVSGCGFIRGTTGEEGSELERGLILIPELIQVVAAEAQNTAEDLWQY